MALMERWNWPPFLTMPCEIVLDYTGCLNLLQIKASVSESFNRTTIEVYTFQ